MYSNQRPLSNRGYNDALDPHLSPIEATTMHLIPIHEIQPHINDRCVKWAIRFDGCDRTKPPPSSLKRVKKLGDAIRRSTSVHATAITVVARF